MNPATRLKNIRALHAQTRSTRSVNEPYDHELKVLIAEHAAERRAQGWTWRQISDELPVSSTTAQTWMVKLNISAPQLVPVTITQAPVDDIGPPPLVLTSPTGFKLSGLNLEQAAQLMSHLR